MNSLDVPTPHIGAPPGSFAKNVLMPGDPLRAKFIAESFLDEAVLVTQVRGMLGYTGYFNGQHVSVMASGMGVPSICIYAHELFAFYDVENIIRVGSAGAINSSLNLYDIVVAVGACSDVDYSHVFGVSGYFAPIASFKLISSAIRIAQKLGIPITVGNILSSSLFYSKTDFSSWQNIGILAVEMEAAGLYSVAAQNEKNALCICTISDIIGTEKALCSEERQLGFKNMIKIALNTIQC
ncbi:MAG: purine-nucleoside phosphorylase [Oscillospiraceae bacterium]|jgi:purine-nucleoside phosphorylase|nr:purine-nucleoside phosphorylase [Oscillospiraceae bacterium]